MLRSRFLTLLLTLTLIPCLSFAENKGQEAAALIEHAKQLSDIRAEGSPPFRLKASIKIVADDGTSREGTYVENWVSTETWRTEIATGSFNQTEVAKDRKLSILSTLPLETDFISPRITALHEHLLAFHMDGNWLLLDYKPSKIEDRVSGSWSLRCIQVNNPFGWTSELCFDQAKGLLVAKSSTKEDVPYGCFYLDYQKFGEKLFPKSIQCLKNGRPVLQGTVTELTKMESQDPSMFSPLQGGRELSHCPHVGLPAQVRAANTFSSHLQSQEPIKISFVLGADAKPHDAVLAHSGGIESEDKLALNSLRNWSFQAATCDGTPVASEMQIVVPNLSAHDTRVVGK